MSYTPVEIRHVRLRKGILGYRRSRVDRLLEEIADSFEAVWRERGELEDRVEQLEADLVRHRELEGLLRTTLTSAERAAHEMRERAAQEADLVVSEARSEARSIVRDAAAERERLAAEARRVRSLLRSALEVVAETDGGAELAAPAEAA